MSLLTRYDLAYVSSERRRPFSWAIRLPFHHGLFSSWPVDVGSIWISYPLASLSQRYLLFSMTVRLISESETALVYSLLTITVFFIACRVRCATSRCQGLTLEHVHDLARCCRCANWAIQAGGMGAPIYGEIWRKYHFDLQMTRFNPMAVGPSSWWHSRRISMVG